MKFKKLLNLIIFCFLLAVPMLVFAAEKKVIFNLDVLTEPTAEDLYWEVVNNSDDQLYPQVDGGLMLRSSGEPSLIYPLPFNYQDYDKLSITLKTNRTVVITLVPDATTTGNTGPEFRRILVPQQDYKTFEFSLRHKFFKNELENFALNFESSEAADIVIQEIVLYKLNPVEVFDQGVKDFFFVSTYLPFTPNLLNTPIIFGHSFNFYFFPLVLLLLFFILLTKKYRYPALIIFIFVWVALDIRMLYEFNAQRIEDNKTFVSVNEQSEKYLRNYGDLYNFSAWVLENTQAEEINFYGSTDAPYARVMQYLNYPQVINNESSEAETFVIYNRADVGLNPDTQTLFAGDKEISKPGKVVNSYNQNSLIFKEND